MIIHTTLYLVTKVHFIFKAIFLAGDWQRPWHIQVSIFDHRSNDFGWWWDLCGTHKIRQHWLFIQEMFRPLWVAKWMVPREWHLNDLSDPWPCLWVVAEWGFHLSREKSLDRLAQTFVQTLMVIRCHETAFVVLRNTSQQLLEGLLWHFASTFLNPEDIIITLVIPKVIIQESKWS